jgi:hypothetical protein
VEMLLQWESRILVLIKLSLDSYEASCTQPIKVRTIRLTSVCLEVKYSFSGRRRSRRQQDVCADFRRLNLPKVLIRIWCVCPFIGVGS